MGRQPRRPSIPERLARRYAAGMVGRLSFGLLAIVLIPVGAAIGVLIFVVLGVVLFGLYALLGEPKALASGVGVGWFLGSLLVLFLVLRRGHRWLARLIALADAPASLIDPYADQELLEANRPKGWGKAPDPLAFPERLAAADARHTPPAVSFDDPRAEPPK